MVLTLDGNLSCVSLSFGRGGFDRIKIVGGFVSSQKQETLIEDSEGKLVDCERDNLIAFNVRQMISDKLVLKNHTRTSLTV